MDRCPCPRKCIGGDEHGRRRRDRRWARRGAEASIRCLSSRRVARWNHRQPSHLPRLLRHRSPRLRIDARSAHPCAARVAIRPTRQRASGRCLGPPQRRRRINGAWLKHQGDQMSDAAKTLIGPDLAKGVELSKIPDGTMLLGHAQGESVLVARRGGELFAIGALCTHYGAPLGDGLLVDDTVRCPWHHACFSLRSGEAVRAPALDPITCWRVEQRDGCAYVREKVERGMPQPLPTAAEIPGSVVIVGGGAAGNAAAETLRREGYSGHITMLSADTSLPCDRPNLSKGYLAGTAPVEFTLLRSPEFYREHRIELKLRA